MPMMARCSKLVIAPVGGTSTQSVRIARSRSGTPPNSVSRILIPRAIMSGHLKYVLTADMSPDEKMRVTGDGNKALNLWVVTSGRLIGHMQGHTSDIESVQFSPNGRVVVSAGEDNSVKIWSVDNQQELA